MRVSEIFDSIQGEGLNSGLMTTFVRFQGCSVGCEWCDTKYAQSFEGGTEMSIEDIAARCTQPYVCLTGGEPLEQDNDELRVLIRKLTGWELSKDVSIETSGCFPKIKEKREADGFTPPISATYVWDVKCPSAKARLPTLMEELRRLEYDGDSYFDQVKFVMRDDRDWDYMREVLPFVNPEVPVILQPVYDKNHVHLKELAEMMLKWGPPPNVRLGYQLHKLIWGNRRGK